MKKFLVLYRAPVSAREQLERADPAQTEAGMALWTRWMQKNGAAILDGGAPLEGGKKFAAGTLLDADATIAGFAIVQSESMLAATKLLHDHPHFHTAGGEIELFEFLVLPGT